MARVVWRCPTPPVVQRYRQRLGRRHLDVGPPVTSSIRPPHRPGQRSPRLTRPERARHSSQRLAAMHPTTVQADVLKPAARRWSVRLGGAQLRAPLLARTPVAQSRGHPERGRRARTRRRVVSAAPSWEPPIDIHHRLAPPSGPSTARRLRQPRGYRQGAPPDPGGFVPGGGGRRDRIGRTL
jgi:hypothetical protein